MAHDHRDTHHDNHGHGNHGHGNHGHGNTKDKEFKAILRYLKIAPRMWKSVVNDAVVDLVAPCSGETVIDIGAGMGPALARAAKSGATVVAVEPTPFLRTVLKARRFLSKDRKRMSVRDGAAEALPVSDGGADAVWAVNTMHHWNSAAEGAAEIVRVLRLGGRVVLVDENFANPAHPNHESWVARQTNGHHHGFSMVDAAEIGDLMTQAGLADVVAEERDLAGRPVIAVLASA